MVGCGAHLGKWTFGLLGLLLSSLAWGQDLATPELLRPSQAQLSFVRQNNFTYSTRLLTHYRHAGPRYEWQLDLSHEQLFNTSRQTDRFVQLQLNAQLWQFWRLSNKWSVASWLEVDQFWNNGTQRYSAYAGLRYEPFEGLSLTPLLGYSYDYRQEILDQGLSPGIRAESRYTFGDGLQMRSHLLARVKYIDPRRQRNLHFVSEWAKVFGPNAAVNLRLHAGRNQMDDYLSESIERIKADTVGVALHLQYPLRPGLIWQSQNSAQLSQREFDYDLWQGEEPEFNDLSFDQVEFRTWQRLSFRRQRWDGRFTYEYQSLGRGYELQNSLELPEPTFRRLVEQERQKDFFRRLHNLDFTLNYRPNARDRFTLSGNNRYLMWDTPSEENYDDHDELYYGLGLEWEANWSRKLMTRYQLIGGIRRYAFLFAERSQDNYTQRNLRLDFDFRWNISPQLSLSGQQYLYVTYNVKDFEDRNLTDRSTRNLESRAQLRYRPQPRWDFELNFYRKETHLSYLNWGAFSETPLDTLTQYLIEGEAHLMLGRGGPLRLRLEAGYKHFSQLRDLNTSMLSLQNILTPINLQIRTHQTGPLTGFRVLARGGSSLEFSVWWQIQDQNYRFQEIERFTSLSAGYREEVLRQREVNLRPFLNLRLNWRL
mgnify:CR=1 FL=1